MRRSAAVATSKALMRAIRLSGRSGGTALPGLIGTRIDPDLLDKLAARLPSGVIVVAGTNGKTTTTRMISGILSRQGLYVIHNRSGSNLVRGIAGAFAEQMPVLGHRGDVGVVESDENAFPDVVGRVNPRVILLLNLFRDQLDRYGELESIATDWKPVVKRLSPETVLCVNADDPRLAALAADTPATVLRFGLETSGHDLPDLPHAADTAYCRCCGSRYDYEAIYLSHLGAYRCLNCGDKRPTLDMAITSIDRQGIERQTITIRNGSDCLMDIELPLPGRYNAYNALAATAAARALGVDREAVRSALGEFNPAFGRLERVQYRGLDLTLALAKNPTGFNEVLRMLGETEAAGAIVIGINDLDADGRDVSWLWDVDFEVLAGGDRDVIVAGIRGHDMAVRMKYAGLPEARLDGTVAGRPFNAVLDHLVTTRQPGERIFVLLTYTAMLQLRQVLADRGAVADFWEQ